MSIARFTPGFLNRLDLAHLQAPFNDLRLQNLSAFLNLSEENLRRVTTDPITQQRLRAGIKSERRQRFIFTEFRSQYHTVYAAVGEATDDQRRMLCNEVCDYITSFRDTLRRGEVFGIVSHLISMYPGFISIDNRSGAVSLLLLYAQFVNLTETLSPSLFHVARYVNSNPESPELP